MKTGYRLFLALLISLVLTACQGTPDGIKPLESFEPEQYSGTWYEIARLDHSFERGLQQVTARYSLREDGGLDVVNRGYDVAKNEWQEADGKAYFVDPPNADGTRTGRLKVSFFGPFYSAYNIIVLDEPHYNYALVCGHDRSYLWILSRTPQLPLPVKAQLIAHARALGFATDELIFVQQQVAR
jgi:apolipoprotein D and lipocalin family protein